MTDHEATARPRHERRNSVPILLPAGRKWKALFAFLGFSGIMTLAMLLIGGGKAWNKWDTMQAQLTDIQKLQREVRELRGRIAELTTAENDTRRFLGLQPIVHQSILDGEPTVYILPRKTAVVENVALKK